MPMATNEQPWPERAKPKKAVAKKRAVPSREQQIAKMQRAIKQLVKDAYDELHAVTDSLRAPSLSDDFEAQLGKVEDIQNIAERANDLLRALIPGR